jgi:hypothetical protein
MTREPGSDLPHAILGGIEHDRYHARSDIGGNHLCVRDRAIDKDDLLNGGRTYRRWRRHVGRVPTRDEGLIRPFAAVPPAIAVRRGNCLLDERLLPPV